MAAPQRHFSVAVGSGSSGAPDCAVVASFSGKTPLAVKKASMAASTLPVVVSRQVAEPRATPSA